MTTWTLTTEASGGPTHSASGVADSRAEAAAALVAAVHAHIEGAAVPARYTFDIDGEVIAILVASDDGDGRPDRAAILKLLDHIDLPRNLSGATTLDAPSPCVGAEIRQRS